MKKIFSLLFIFCFFTSFSQVKKTVKLLVTYSNKYCGGARPTPEILEKEKEKYPLANTTLRLVDSKKRKSILVKLNELGKASVCLRQGEYSVYMSKKFGKQSQACNFSPLCDKSLTKTYATFSLGNESDVQLNFHFTCNPCDALNGKKE